jgi:hypothetical protein
LPRLSWKFSPETINLKHSRIIVAINTGAANALIYGLTKETKMRYRLFIYTLVLMILTTLVSVSPVQAQGCEYWVAPTGSNSNPGTSAQPWATLEHASGRVMALQGSNCTVWFKDGVYTGYASLEERFSTLITFKAVNPYKAVLQNTGTVLDLSGAKNMVFEGFEIRHSSPSAGEIVVYVARSGNDWAENIIFRNNIFHDSYNNDLLKILDGSRFVTVENNIFYNQAEGEQLIDVNSVTDVTIQDNIFFNDFAGSGRVNGNDTKHYIVIKDSNEGEDGLLGSERITVRRNVFLNWQGAEEFFVQVGNDGKSYYEAKEVRVENNLLIGNSSIEMSAPFGVAGARDVTFANNTIVGNLPASSFAARIVLKGSNPVNQNIFFYNNIWSDPTRTMGDFSSGSPSEVSNLALDNNLYWNGGASIPSGEQISPTSADAHRVVANPGLNTNQSSVTLPRWNGTSFLSGSGSVRQEFERLVDLYGQLPFGSPAIDRANPSLAPVDDILGHYRGATAEIGAYEYNWTGATTFRDVAYTHWAWKYIEAIYNAGITGGCGTAPLIYCPANPVTRAQMAVFLLRGIHGNSYAPPPATGGLFGDVPSGYWAAAWVEQLAAEGITGGCGAGNFCPDAIVTRDQMAVFLLRARHGSAYTPPPASGVVFSDVNSGYWAAAWIEQLAAEGITGGCTADKYCPTAQVSRDQMAVFLQRTFNLPLP